jgi:hypothetical protein
MEIMLWQRLQLQILLLITMKQQVVMAVVFILRYGVHQITNTTIFGNTANSIGAMYMGFGTTTITNSTIANNTGGISDGIYIEGSGTLRMKNTILANNTTTDFSKGTATITDNGYNIVEVSSGYAWSGTGDITGDQANLNLSGTLADNGTVNGTQTLVLSAGSVAIDAGNGTANNGVSIPATDQRGVSRSGATDIGAYEYEADVTAPTVSTLSPTDGATGVATTADLVITFDEEVDADQAISPYTNQMTHRFKCLMSLQIFLVRAVLPLPSIQLQIWLNRHPTMYR